MRLICLFLLSIANLSQSTDLVDGVVNIKCGSQEDNIASLSYFGDSLQVSAFMSDGTRCPFKQNIATATWSLSVAFTENELGRCVMAKIPNRRIYSIDVISFRRSPEFESEDDEKFLMECNFETYKEEVENGLSVVDGSLASPRVVETHEGKKSDSNFTISIVHNDDLPLASMEVGRIARLKVTMTPSVKENHKGFMPVKCEVMTPDRKKRSVILANGCGTGYPFHQNQGFHMEETVGRSPPFRMFRLNPMQGLSFVCSFVTCGGDCKGSTCPAERTVEDREKRALIVTARKPISSEAETTLPDIIAEVTPQTPVKDIPQEQKKDDFLHGLNDIPKRVDQRHGHNNLPQTVDRPQGLKNVPQEKIDQPEVLINEAQDQVPARESQKAYILNAMQVAKLTGEEDLAPGGQRILLISRVDARAFSRTVKLAVFGTSAFVLTVFVLLTLFIICKFRRIEQ